MKGFQFLFMIGSALMAVSCIGDSFFHLSDTIVTLGILASAIVMWIAIRLQKSENPEVRTASHAVSPKRRFVLLSVATLVGLLIGFFALRSAHPEQSVALHVAISIFTLVICMTILYRKAVSQSVGPLEKRETQE